MTSFVVLSTQRSGSSWVVDMLTSHPRVVAYSELFMRRGRAEVGSGAGPRVLADVLPRRMTLHERAIAGTRARFKKLGLPYTEVVYEHLDADETGFAALFEFLAVDPAPVTSSLQKLNPTSHEQLIENYGEVRDALAETEFAGLLR